MKNIISKGLTILISTIALLAVLVYFVINGMAAGGNQSSSSGSSSSSIEYYHFDVRIAAQFTHKIKNCDCECEDCGCETDSTTVAIDGVSIDSAIVYNTSGTTWSLSNDSSIYGTSGTTTEQTTVEGTTIASGVNYFYVNFFDDAQADENVSSEDVFEFQSIAGHKDPSDSDGSEPNAGLKYVTNDTIVLTYTITYTLDGQEYNRTQTLVREVCVANNDCELKNYTNDMLGFDIAISAEDMEMEQLSTTSVSVAKEWDDNENQAGKRPDSVTVRLTGTGAGTTLYSEDVILSEENQWSYTWEGLTQYYCGCTVEECESTGTCAQEISYNVEEINVPEGYEATVSGSYSEGFTITNALTAEPEPEFIDVAGMVTWDDADNQDGIRPEQVTVYLYADGTLTDWVYVSVKEGGTYSFTDLQKYNNGQEIVYTVTENEITGYTTDIDNYNIKNTHVPETIDVSGEAMWDDADNQDGIRPEEAELYLYADGVKIDSVTVTADGDWKYDFTDLPKYSDGKEITYSIGTQEVSNYSADVEGFDVTYTHVPEEIDIEGTVIWKDKEDQDGIRPDEVTIDLYAGDTKVGSVTVTADDNWKYSFNDLPKYKDGVEIVYSISEEAVDQYTSKTDVYDVTYTHVPLETEVTGTVIWDDEDDKDGLRPDKVTIYLYADGTKVDSVTISEKDGWEYSFTELPMYEDGKKIVYTIDEELVDEYDSEVTGYDVNYKHVPEVLVVSGQKIWYDGDNQDGIRPSEIEIYLNADGKQISSVSVTADENWKYSFLNLPKYSDGKEIVYTISEKSVSGYTIKISGYDVINTHKPAEVDVAGTIIWKDSKDQDGIRPDKVIIYLMADGVRVDSVEVTADDNWKYSFNDLPKNANGTEITYTIGEKAVTGYETSIESYDVTNVHEPEVIAISGKKTWDDADNQDGIRPNAITVLLKVDDTTISNVVATAENNWEYSFKDLPKYSEGKLIEYKIDEKSVFGYEAKVSGYNITNTHEPEEVDVTGTITWDDEDDQDGIRPDKVVVRLCANGKEIKSIVVTENDGWKYSFSDVPKYNNGEEIQYTISEDTISGYDITIDGNDIANAHTPEVVVKVVTNIWDDGNNQDGIRPLSVTIQLFGNGNKVGSEVTLSEENAWSYTYEGLDKYENGSEILYTVLMASEVKDYTSSYEQEILTIKNAYAPGKTSYTVLNIWNDNNNADGKRPETVMVQLYANGMTYGSPIALSKTNMWTYTWSDLDEYNSGELVTYSVKLLDESDVYTVTVLEDGKTTTIENVYVPEVAVQTNNGEATVGNTGDDGRLLITMVTFLVSLVVIKCVWLPARGKR